MNKMPDHDFKEENLKKIDALVDELYPEEDSAFVAASHLAAVFISRSPDPVSCMKMIISIYEIMQMADSVSED